MSFWKKALEEVVAAFDWYTKLSTSAAERYLEELGRAVEWISSSPSRWPEYTFGAHGFLLHRFPFAIIYRELPESVQVLAVAHTRRRPNYWKQRI